MESYEQSKRTPAYKELNAKYKALKKTHAELLLVLTSLNHPSNRAAPSKHRSLRKSRKEESNIIETFAETDEEDLKATSPAPELKSHQSSLCNPRTPKRGVSVLEEPEDAEEEVIEVFANNAEYEVDVLQCIAGAQRRENRNDDSGLDAQFLNVTEILEIPRLDEVVLVNELELETPSESETNLIQNDALTYEDESSTACAVNPRPPTLSAALTPRFGVLANIKCDELPESPRESLTDQIAAEIIAENEAGFCDENEIDVDAEEETEEIEVEEETEEIEEEEEEEEEEETEEIEVEEEEEEEEAGVYEIEINGTRYFTTNEQDGIVYEAVGEDDVGDEIGKFVKGKLVLSKF